MPLRDCYTRKLFNEVYEAFEGDCGINAVIRRYSSLNSDVMAIVNTRTLGAEDGWQVYKEPLKIELDGEGDADDGEDRDDSGLENVTNDVHGVHSQAPMMKRIEDVDTNNHPLGIMTDTPQT
ncbi:hypothetical protein HDU76_013553, partial [Blyttiomyces sp. JEL0837]